MSAGRAERMTLFTSASAKTEKKKKLGCWNDGVRRAWQGRAGHGSGCGWSGVCALHAREGSAVECMTDSLSFEGQRPTSTVPLTLRCYCLPRLHVTKVIKKLPPSRTEVLRCSLRHRQTEYPSKRKSKKGEKKRHNVFVTQPPDPVHPILLRPCHLPPWLGHHPSLQRQYETPR